MVQVVRVATVEGCPELHLAFEDLPEAVQSVLQVTVDHPGDAPPGPSSSEELGEGVKAPVIVDDSSPPVD